VSGAMNPYPFVGLNHFTVPLGIDACLSACEQRPRTLTRHPIEQERSGPFCRDALPCTMASRDCWRPPGLAWPETTIRAQTFRCNISAYAQKTPAEAGANPSSRSVKSKNIACIPPACAPCRWQREPHPIECAPQGQAGADG
jgi:hypothetical protein